MAPATNSNGEIIGPMEIIPASRTEYLPERNSAWMPLQDIQQMAKIVVESGLFPALKTPQAAAGLMLLCNAEGLHPMTAMRRYDIIQGRPAMRSDAMLAEFQKRGGTVRWIRMDDQACEASFRAPGVEGDLAIRWTMEMANTAGLTKKDNWRNYARAMLRARVISEGVRSTMPAVVVGIYSEAETEDMEPRAPSPVEAAFADAGVSVEEITAYLGRAPDFLSAAEQNDLRRVLGDHKAGRKSFDTALAERAETRNRMVESLCALRAKDKAAFDKAADESVHVSVPHPERMSFENLSLFYSASLKVQTNPKPQAAKAAKPAMPKPTPAQKAPAPAPKPEPAPESEAPPPEEERPPDVPPEDSNPFDVPMGG